MLIWGAPSLYSLSRAFDYTKRLFIRPHIRFWRDTGGAGYRKGHFLIRIERRGGGAANLDCAFYDSTRTNFGTLLLGDFMECALRKSLLLVDVAGYI